MKTSKLLNIILAIALVVVSARLAMSESKIASNEKLEEGTSTTATQDSTTDFKEFDVTKALRK